MQAGSHFRFGGSTVILWIRVNYCFSFFSFFITKNNSIQYHFFKKKKISFGSFLNKKVNKLMMISFNLCFKTHISMLNIFLFIINKPTPQWKSNIHTMAISQIITTTPIVNI